MNIELLLVFILGADTQRQLQDVRPPAAVEIDADRNADDGLQICGHELHWRIGIKGRAVPLNKLESRLERAAKRVRKVVIHVDDDVPWAQVISAMQLCKKVGLDKVELRSVPARR